MAITLGTLTVSTSTYSRTAQMGSISTIQSDEQYGEKPVLSSQSWNACSTFSANAGNSSFFHLATVRAATFLADSTSLKYERAKSKSVTQTRKSDCSAKLRQPLSGLTQSRNRSSCLAISSRESSANASGNSFFFFSLNSKGGSVAKYLLKTLADTLFVTVAGTISPLIASRKLLSCLFAAFFGSREMANSSGNSPRSKFNFQRFFCSLSATLSWRCVLSASSAI